jgi:hypothetical protein
MDGKIVFKNQENASVQCDLALFAFLNILIKMQTDTRIQEYDENKKLRVRWIDKKLQENPALSLNPYSIPKWKVKLAMGLHLGWAFEGAIGTQYKIDASYISNDISKTFLLSDISKAFDTPIILSEELFTHLSPVVRKFCKPVEKINFGDFTHIVYCVQHDLANIAKKERLVNKYENRDAFQKAHQRKKMEFMELLEEKNAFSSTDYINDHKKIKALFEKNNEKTLEKFADGFERYAKGKWEEAKMIFEDLLKMEEDPSAKKILAYMERRGFHMPEGWKGVELVGSFDP